MSNPIPKHARKQWRRKQWRPKGRPSDARRALRRRALRLNAPEEIPAPTTEVDLRIDAQVARDHKRVREQRGVTNERLNEPRAMYESIRGPRVANPRVSETVRRTAMILGAEMWRRQVTRVVISIADKVEGMANMAGAEIAELGNELQKLTTRVRKLELVELANVAERERAASRKRKASRARTSRRKGHGGAS